MPLLLIVACQDKPADTAEGEVACAARSEQRQLFWGDLHVHTSYSFDAYPYDIRLEPEDAYAFARGEAVLLPPLDANGVGTVSTRLERPLDFVAVTDHSEFLGEVSLCTTEGSAVYDSTTCVDYRTEREQGFQALGVQLALEEPERHSEICADEALCAEQATDTWSRLQQAAHAAYDGTDACSLTTFVGYEWTGATANTNLHRNVLFRNEHVPVLPVSYYDEPTPEGMLRRLAEDCLGLPGCDVISIPHNANLSNGRQFHFDGDAELATLRATLEPLMEIYQHKGDSECRNGLAFGEDELCSFEKFPIDDGDDEDCGEDYGAGGMSGGGCVSDRDYLRGILAEGLRVESSVGVNPYRLGVIASTDTHQATPGLTLEEGFAGHLGIAEDEPSERLSNPGLTPGGIVNSGGGLAAVWATENRRDAIFDALKRRETYGTSGPRISLRFFAGDLEPGICDDADLVASADSVGVPMGATWTGTPTFVVSAAQDVDGLPLQRAQIIKGWLEDGEPRVEVVDVAGGDNGASVDLDTCAVVTAGASSLCGVWTDPSPPDGPAWYYARVVEDPSCRWSWRDCLADGAGEDNCDTDQIEKIVQERAWSSPIWVEPS